MKTVLLHVGAHKTGTFSFQRLMSEYRKNSHNSKFDYLGPEVNHSKLMVGLFAENPARHHLFANKNFSTSDLEQLKKSSLEKLNQALYCTDETLLISGEEIGTMSSIAKEGLVDFFKSKGFNVQILLVVRDPSDLAASLIQQWIKGGVRQTFSINSLYRKYWEFFAFSDEVSMKVFSYENLLSRHGDVASGLAAEIGFDCGKEKKKGRSLDWVNTGLSQSATKVLYRLNQLFRETDSPMVNSPQKIPLLQILRETWPKSDEDSLNTGILSSAITTDARYEVNDLRDLFEIDYSSTDLRSFNLQEVTDYLEDLSDVPLSNIRFVPKVASDADSALMQIMSSLK